MTAPRIHHLDCGTMCPVAGRFVGVAELVCHCLVIETARDGAILVDTGFSTIDCAEPARLHPIFRHVVRPRLDPARTALGQLAGLGLAPRDVRHVVVTHLDPDHAGGLVDFPWATVHVHRAEHDAAMARTDAKSRGRYWINRWAHAPKWATYEAAGDTWLELPAVRRLDGVDADVALVPLIGHSRGHSAVAIATGGDRWLLHAGDAYFHRDELATPPAAPRALRWFATLDEIDRGARLASVERLRRLRTRGDVDIICAHDPVELARHA